jgi:formylglycine-generating enzyme required for sulfatase activity
MNVPGGTFTQGSADTTALGAQPPHQSTVSSFALDKYEVTVGRFRKFVTAYVSNTATVPADGAGVNPAIAGTGWQTAWNTSLPADQATFASWLKCSTTYQTWTDAAGSNENKAINCVDWYEAFAFCIWDGGRLATESEWEYAAAGGGGVDGNRLYPWGSAAPDCTYANFYNGYYCSGGSGSVVAVGSTLAGNGKWGHADLAGNVWEWAFDWFATYSASASNNYANATAGSGRVMRGGGFGGHAMDLRAADRSWYDDPGVHGHLYGARCARTVQ